MTPRLAAILIGLFVVLAAGGVMLIPSGNESGPIGQAPGQLPGNRSVPGRNSGSGAGLMMNQGGRTIAAPTRPAPSAQSRDGASAPTSWSSDGPKRADAADRAVVSEASGEVRRTTPSTRGPASSAAARAGRQPSSAARDRASADRSAEIARQQALRDARVRSQMAQRTVTQNQRAAGRNNAQVTTNQDVVSEGVRVTSGSTGTGTGSGTGSNSGSGSGSTSSGSGSGTSGSGSGTSGGRGELGGMLSGGSSNGGLSGGSAGNGSIIGGVPDIKVAAEFRQVQTDTSACEDLVGYRTVDLYLTFSQQVGVLTVQSAGTDRLRVMGGELKQMPGGGNTPPNAGLVTGSPCLAHDSYFDLGGVPISFAAGPTTVGGVNQLITATWYTLSPAQTSLRNGVHELRIARFTAPTTINDIAGTIGVNYTVSGLQGVVPVSVTLPSVAAIFTGEPPTVVPENPDDSEEEPKPEEPKPEEPKPVYGACCFSTGNCQGDLTAEDCLAQGGVYQGDNTTCASSVCPVVPETPGNGGGDNPDQPNGGEGSEGGNGEDDPDDRGIAGYWLEVDNAGVVCNEGVSGHADLSGAKTFDLYLRMDAAHRLLLVESNPSSSHLMINGGSVFQHSQGTNTAPNPSLFEIVPCLEFDSYLVFEDVAAPIAAPQPSMPSIIGLNSAGGSGVLSETNWSGAFGALWFLTPPPSILGEQNPSLFGDQKFYVRIGRFTLPPGVSISGSINANFTLAGTGGAASIKNIPVPTVSGN